MLRDSFFVPLNLTLQLNVCVRASIEGGGKEGGGG
jgi:hypothetical protein